MSSAVLKAGDPAEDFPIACETCLGECPSVRIIRGVDDKECKICEVPTTTFRWQPGPRARYKTTIICAKCARKQNVCQVCLFDLKYGLPVQVRDSVARQALPEESVRSIARTAPYYRRNLSRICTFWMKGQCNRGEKCPFRHEKEMISDDPQNPTVITSGSIKKMRDRYFGVNDEFADRLLNALHSKAEQKADDQLPQNANVLG